MITIIDLGIGNLGSLKNMLEYLDISCEITKDLNYISNSKKIILSGVGSFDSSMYNINSNKELKSILNELVLTKKIPILGICMGMQIMLESSEEGNQEGLGWIQGKVKKFKNSTDLKIPHMGWNIANINKENALCEIDQKYYFVHSYYTELKDMKNCMMTTNYGVKFCSGIFDNNIYGVQFHPEKSHKNGMLLLKNFSNL